MPKFETTRHVHHTADEMFALVADVESYPEFLPLCHALSVRSEREKEGKRLLIADMTVAYKMIRETFTSQVLLKPEERRIEVSYVNGPFKFLDNRWTFEPTGEGECNVKFFIEYEFKSRTLGVLMGSMFDYAFRRFATAFEERADKIYS
ncbi:type II toxin-antitoxin system RatA family toxin [Jiella sp. MQZ9-1]|uniref:Type II toxin-antitoxin system RatA family toxin n=1 Tax=Jiella flava TaxID=2816857 RepID=A0A939G0A5_9HYPH|nr:type II toxin-antitoxin system RatA family toxin [Jiella flava]MBO0662684.1 type II toxin-antitoxin system RatA family toxin [Jiella flava]MCD2471106.1 type II toxin-antitoxin system RatA family toxin [Jiella flava]